MTTRKQQRRVLVKRHKRLSRAYYTAYCREDREQPGRIHYAQKELQAATDAWWAIQMFDHDRANGDAP